MSSAFAELPFHSRLFAVKAALIGSKLSDPNARTTRCNFASLRAHGESRRRVGRFHRLQGVGADSRGWNDGCGVLERCRCGPAALRPPRRVRKLD